MLGVVHGFLMGVKKAVVAVVMLLLLSCCCWRCWLQGLSRTERAMQRLPF
jgi:hypothetical protein